MCLISFAWQASAEFPFACVANRDEFHQRPTQHLHWWEDAPIAAGRDLQAGGTWLGVNARGRFAAVTNFRQGKSMETYAKSRGQLVRSVLNHHGDLADLEAEIQSEEQQYAGFNLLYGDLFDQNRQLRFLSNRTDECFVIGPGIYSFSNGAFNSDWPKSRISTNKLTRALRQRRPAGFWDVVSDRATADVDELPDTGIGTDAEQFLSAVFIVGETYGTRSSHRILCRQNSEISVSEKRFDPSGEVTGVSTIRVAHPAA